MILHKCDAKVWASIYLHGLVSVCTRLVVNQFTSHSNGSGRSKPFEWRGLLVAPGGIKYLAYLLVMGSVSDAFQCPWCGRRGNGGYAPDSLGYPVCVGSDDKSPSCLYKWVLEGRGRGEYFARALDAIFCIRPLQALFRFRNSKNQTWTEVPANLRNKIAMHLWALAVPVVWYAALQVVYYHVYHAWQRAVARRSWFRGRGRDFSTRGENGACVNIPTDASAFLCTWIDCTF